MQTIQTKRESNIKTATKIFDYTTIVGRLRMLSNRMNLFTGQPGEKRLPISSINYFINW